MKRVKNNYERLACSYTRIFDYKMNYSEIYISDFNI